MLFRSLRARRGGRAARLRRLRLLHVHGLPDGAEDLDANGRWDPGAETNPLGRDTDADGLLDGEEDLNGDGQFQETEPSPLVPDSDGDGLLDAVQVTETIVRYRLNLGWGRFAETWQDLVGVPSPLEPDVRLVDMNGDALSDLLEIYPGEIQISLNRDGLRFDPPIAIGAGNAISAQSIGSAEIPRSLLGVKIRLLDLNGNGSTDVVWIKIGRAHV